MTRKITLLVLTGVFGALLPGAVHATTREIADLQPARLTFGQSVVNQLTHDTYRDPFDELQTRPYNLLFNNIGRYSNLSPWPGQTGNYTHYFNALIGNNGTANVDNDADSIQGALVRRETLSIAWGVSAAVLAGSDGSNDTVGTTSFVNDDNLAGYDLRTGAALQISDRRVLGGGIRLTQANAELIETDFEPGLGGFNGLDSFDQFGFTADFGIRQFQTPLSSWEAQIMLGFASAEQDEIGEDLDDTGAVVSRLVTTNYDISDVSIGLYGGYNRQHAGSLGETEFRAGIERSMRELDNPDLSFLDTGGTVTPVLTLLGLETIETTEVHASVKTIFQAGQTELFAGAQVGYSMVEGSTQVDASGTTVNEMIDDSRIQLGLTVGLRQPLFQDKLRFIVSGRGDLLDQERSTVFDASSNIDDMTQTTAQYAIGLEGVLANVVFDLAWLVGDEAPVVPVPLGLPAGSRRTVEFDRVVFSAAVAW